VKIVEGKSNAGENSKELLTNQVNQHGSARLIGSETERGNETAARKLENSQIKSPRHHKSGRPEVLRGELPLMWATEGWRAGIK